MVFYCYFQQYFSYIVALSFIGLGNRSTRRKPLTFRKSLTNLILHDVSSTPRHISVILSVLLVEETGVPAENH
jgi:hypothetical protein